MSDAIREAFEKWALSRYGGKFALDEYHEAVLGFGWEAWQAALQSQTAPALPEEIHGILALDKWGSEGPAYEPYDKRTLRLPMDHFHALQAWLSTAPQPDNSPDAGKVVQGEPVADKVEWIKGFPPCDGDGGICHIPLKGYPDFMAIAFNNEGSLVDGCGDDIGWELDDVDRWRPLNASALALTHQVTGARDMLREAAKQFRSNNDIGHAAMCENHADEIDRLRARQQEGGEG